MYEENTSHMPIALRNAAGTFTPVVGVINPNVSTDTHWAVDCNGLRYWIDKDHAFFDWMEVGHVRHDHIERIETINS